MVDRTTTAETTAEERSRADRGLEGTGKKPWREHVIEVLPMQQTATNIQTGNDGLGSYTAS